MKQIPLTQGKVALVDDQDFEYLNQWKWHIHSKSSIYASRSFNYKSAETGKWTCKQIFMHHIILPTPEGLFVDHINGNRLDNTRKNLRLCTIEENARNSKACNNKGNPKGITWKPSLKKWEAKIRANKKTLYLGVYKEIEDAARAYDEAAKIYFGDFARLNNVGELHKIYNPTRQVKTSTYRGVHWKERDKKYYATISKQKKKTYIGAFNCPIEAARAYNEEAIKLYGEFAKLNHIPE